MKTKRILWPLLALVALSCGKEMVVETPEPQPSQPEVRDRWTFYPEEETVLEGKEPHTVIAGFAATKSHLVDNGSGNYAVHWTKNDQFRVYGFGSGKVIRAIYTASTSGERAEFTTLNDLGASTRFAAVYPESAAIRTTSIDIGGGEKAQGYWTDFPILQTATPGSVAEDANIAFAEPASLDEPLEFKNVVSLLKFRLSGDVVGQVKSITLRGTDYLAGGYAFISQSGEPAVLPNVSQEGHDKSKTIILSGPFEAGQDYFIALAPCIQEGLSMIFANGNQTITKTTAKTIRFDRSAITDFGTIKLGNSFTETVSTDPIKYIEATAGNPKPVTIAVIPEGYTATELADYELQAKSGIEALFNTEPYKTYRDYFNVWILKVASNDSGAKITDGSGNVIVDRDCYFETKWGQDSYSDMRANDNKVFDFVEANCPDIVNGIHTIEEVPVLIIINDTRYGGRAISWENGMSYCMAPTTAGGLTWLYPEIQADPSDVNATTTVETTQEEYAELGKNVGNWRNTLVHEFGGHSFGRLGDEYWYSSSKSAVSAIARHSYPVPFSLNISASSATTPWDDLLQLKTALIAVNPLYERISVFQGGDVSVFNRWRSEKVSCMIDNRFYFSTWQRYLIVNRIRTLAGITGPMDLADFFANDDPTDPLRDVTSSPVRGVSDAIPPRPVPMLPPPLIVDE